MSGECKHRSVGIDGIKVSLVYARGEAIHSSATLFLEKAV